MRQMEKKKVRERERKRERERERQKDDRREEGGWKVTKRWGECWM